MLRISRDEYTGHIKEAQCEECKWLISGLTDITEEDQINHRCENGGTD